jgi:hypothetical protein
MIIRAFVLALQFPKFAHTLGNTLRSAVFKRTKTTAMAHAREFYRSDGVRITHDPYSPEMVERYGMPGATDSEGFDPYKDSAGAGIYGGIVKRSESGGILIGKQYQNHNPRPGPVYAGGGYTPSSLMLDDINGKLIPLLDKFPELVNDVTTGGAQPLHTCGMSRNNQIAVSALVERGADLEALDTYGMTPLHRMASNNLAVGANMLLEAGADVFNKGKVKISPMSMAKDSAAHAVVQVLKEAEEKAKNKNTSGSKENVTHLTVLGSNILEVNGNYLPKTPLEIPSGFAKVCDHQGWNTNDMWSKLNGLDLAKDIWFAHSDNASYIYWNKNDKKWWIDEPDGSGVWIVGGPSHAPPAHGWSHVMSGEPGGAPMVMTFRKLSEKNS